MSMSGFSATRTWTDSVDTNLRSTPFYNFHHDAANGNQRFKLILISKTYGIEDDPETYGNTFNLVIKDRNIALDFTPLNLGVASVEDHNVTGQLIYKEKNTTLSHHLPKPLRTLELKLVSICACR